MILRKTGRVAAICAVGAAAGLVLRRTTTAVATSESMAFDAALREQFLSMQSSAADVISDVATALSAPALLVTATCILAFALRRRGASVWMPIAAAPFVAMTAGAVFTRTFPQQYAPDSAECEPCFPSGHTTGVTAEAATVAYVLLREHLIRPRTGIAILLGPILGGVNRLYRDRHWATDIIAGWSAGIAVASLCAAMSELV